jgi:hypothetical protein
MDSSTDADRTTGPADWEVARNPQKRYDVPATRECGSLGRKLRFMVAAIQSETRPMRAGAPNFAAVEPSTAEDARARLLVMVRAEAASPDATRAGWSGRPGRLRSPGRPGEALQRAGGRSRPAVVFGGVTILTAPGLVMTPRPSTEPLVDAAVELIGSRSVRVADVGTGTGTGAVAVALPRRRELARPRRDSRPGSAGACDLRARDGLQLNRDLIEACRTQLDEQSTLIMQLYGSLLSCGRGELDQLLREIEARAAEGCEARAAAAAGTARRWDHGTRFRRVRRTISPSEVRWLRLKRGCDYRDSEEMLSAPLRPTGRMTS